MLPITKENEPLLRSGYEARTEQELPVLVRWFPAESLPSPPVAKYLDIILYSREQINKEVRRAAARRLCVAHGGVRAGGNLCAAPTAHVAH